MWLIFDAKLAYFVHFCPCILKNGWSKIFSDEVVNFWNKKMWPENLWIESFFSLKKVANFKFVTSKIQKHDHIMTKIGMMSSIFFVFWKVDHLKFWPLKLPTSPKKNCDQTIDRLKFFLYEKKLITSNFPL